MARPEKQETITRLIPKEGLQITSGPGKVLTRVHLDLAKDGVTLAAVGAASAALKRGNGHRLTLKGARNGITLSLVGAASAAAKG